MTRFRFLAPARDELREAVAWSEQSRAGGGRSLLAEVRRGIACILEAPERWPRWSEKRLERKFVLRRVPYSIIYEVVDGIVVIKAVAHMKRRAGYWRSRPQR